MDDVALRPLRQEDAPHAARIYFAAVHEGTAALYDAEQRRAWGGEREEPERWRERLEGMQGFVAEIGGVPQGFMTIDAEGLVDLAFVHPSAARRGIGAMLLAAVEGRARELGVTRLWSEASKASRPFFARHGWAVVTEQQVERDGVKLTNYRMEKRLA